MERQALNFSVQFRVGEQVSGGDYRHQFGISGAMAGACIRLDFYSYGYAVSLQRAVGSVRIDYALIENRSFFSLAALRVAPHWESRPCLSRALPKNCKRAARALIHA
jgi:hypothetical protein